MPLDDDDNGEDGLLPSPSQSPSSIHISYSDLGRHVAAGLDSCHERGATAAERGRCLGRAGGRRRESMANQGWEGTMKLGGYGRKRGGRRIKKKFMQRIANASPSALWATRLPSGSAAGQKPGAAREPSAAAIGASSETGEAIVAAAVGAVAAAGDDVGRRRTRRRGAGQDLPGLAPGPRRRQRGPRRGRAAPGQLVG